MLPTWAANGPLRICEYTKDEISDCVLLTCHDLQKRFPLTPTGEHGFPLSRKGLERDQKVPRVHRNQEGRVDPHAMQPVRESGQSGKILP